MPTLKINEIEIEVEPGTSVLQACEQLGVEIPRFCYHDRLTVPANCRMCLVEQKGAPKPIPSCAMQCADGMEILTHSELTTKARHGVMEFLLINHPLDCPICDQGGECDLQDQAMAYGFDRSRYVENKRAVEEKYMGPLIKTIMTRCIHCTRCVRFAEEIAGVPELGMLGRGEHAEIGTYVEQAVHSELSGNMIDICPVGALTSKPYAFNARPWELRKTETIDALDAVGSNIRVDSRGAEVLRVLPRLHEDINEEWIGDKTRFAYDGLKRQRLDRPFVRENGKLRPASWQEAFDAIAGKVKAVQPSQIAALAGDMCDAEAMFALKSLMQALGAGWLECRQDGARFDTRGRAGYIMNSGIAGIEDADAILLVGTNPRREAAMVNARIRKRWFNAGCKIGVVGPQADLSYDYSYLGAGGQTLSELAEGKHPFIETLKAAENPMIIVGMGALQREDGPAVQAAARKIAVDTGMIREDWTGFNMLHTAAARVGALDLGFAPEDPAKGMADLQQAAQNGEVKLVYLLGADEFGGGEKPFGDAFIVYQGHHGDRGATLADVILPGAAYTEKTGTYVNTEGRVQIARKATFPPGDAREDWAILRALSEPLGHKLPFDTLVQLRTALRDAYPGFGAVGMQKPEDGDAFGVPGQIIDASFAPAIENYYMTDPISRASVTMAQCTSEILQGQSPAKGTGTDG